MIRNLFAALAEACGLEKPSPAWWINFRVIDEGNWGSRGGVLSFLDLLDQGPSAFAPERVGRDQNRPRRPLRTIIVASGIDRIGKRNIAMTTEGTIRTETHGRIFQDHHRQSRQEERFLPRR